MDLFEKINRSFGSWYEGLFGSAGSDVRPKDILRQILACMEDQRKEGFDNRIYVPNQYVLEVNVHDEEEKAYLLSFLDRDELETAVRRYCQQNHYHIRGVLDFTIREVTEGELGDTSVREKVRVRARYDTKITVPEPAPSPAAHDDFEERTVASVNAVSQDEEEGTVAAVPSAALVVYTPDRPPFRYPIRRSAVVIGRSPRAANDLVVEGDGQMSKRHARIELDADGRFTLYDLGSTNGSRVNGRRVDNRTLHDGDEVVLGSTRFAFQQSEAVAEPPLAVRPPARPSQGNYGGAAAIEPSSAVGSGPVERPLRPRNARLILLDGDQELDDYLLASETAIGRGVTNDIVLPDRSIATYHARIVNGGDAYRLECLADGVVSLLNGQAAPPRQAMLLSNGDVITLGALTLRFEGA